MNGRQITLVNWERCLLKYDGRPSLFLGINKAGQNTLWRILACLPGGGWKICSIFREYGFRYFMV